MSLWRWISVVLGFGLFLPAVVLAAELPDTIDVSPCKSPPVIDGVLADDEWKEAREIEFEMPFVRLKSMETTPRKCTLRVMNSANGLYVALRVPDATLNKSLNPLDFDFAMLAFCRGDALAAGDDRKVLAPGIYVDKHLTAPGKDADDKQQDGLGAMLHRDGICTLEWALPLKSTDAEDLQCAPGDSVRFNIGYFDAFQADLKETQAGSAYSGGLDQADRWGTLRLAKEVVDDGGTTFEGPKWIAERLAREAVVQAKRLQVGPARLISGGPQAVAKVLLEFPYRGPRGEQLTGKAKLYIPTSLEKESRPRPLYHNAGYELDDASAIDRVNRGFIVATQRELEANPLVRTVNPDVALLHIVRSLSWVDDAHVVVAGGSAGGYATLMVAAETFPLSGAAPDVPPINWGYNAAFFLQREPRTPNSDPQTPVFDVIVPIVQQALGVYGEQTDDETYFRHSPLAHLDTITCPVSVYWTTADMLVPIDQVGEPWVRPFDAEKFPPGFRFAPDKLFKSAAALKRPVRLLDSLAESEYEVFVIPEEKIKALVAGGAKGPPELQVSSDRRWSITILDEGPPEPQVGHQKYPLGFSQRPFLEKSQSGALSVDQLTQRKLERLMDRYAGREWLPTALVHLDTPENERADVVRGLRTYTAVNKSHAARFDEIYRQLDSDRQVLPAELVRELSGTK